MSSTNPIVPRRGPAPPWRPVLCLAAAALTVCLLGCGAGSDEGGSGERRGGGGPPGGRRAAGGAPGSGSAAVPVEVLPVVRREISSYIETNGTLEAENEIDLVARVSGPVLELRAEEGQRVAEGQVLARLDETELRAQLEIARVTLDETRLTYDRAQVLDRERLISAEDLEAARSRHDSARAQFEATRIQLGYTEIRAPFQGWIVERYIDQSQHVATNTPLFRISDFDPLLCPIQVPERELNRLRVGQRAHLNVEAWPDERFEARVLRISPVVAASTGTVKVTLEVTAQGRLRPGMFASVFIRTATRPDALVVPKSALSLESIGDTVYVAQDGTAVRREVELGFEEGDFVEIVSGVAENDRIVVVGQDGLSDGTPIQVLGAGAPPAAALATAAPATDEPAARERGRGGRGGRPDFASMTPDQLEQAKARMRERGMSDAQIEERIARARPRTEPDGD